MPFIDETAAAEFLGLSVKILRNWRWQGRGPSFSKFGRSVRYDQRELEEWARAQQVGSTTEAQAREREAS